MRFVKVLLAALTALVVVALPAAAQYPGTTSTTVAPTNQTLGTLAVGAETTVLSCGFRPGTVSVSLNGQSSVSDTADADGCVRTAIAVLSASQVRVEGATQAATCTNDVLSVTGTAAGGGARTVTTSFGIDCPSGGGGGGGGGLPRTGAMILRWSLGGGALLAVGALLVLSGRRRNTAVVSG
ncbi:MAG: hypothetical protein ACR2MO_00155 [Acidimicrobiales bacterium]